ncbi:serine protease [Kappamyces sp. JEL0680]|nr:serine protease [Kappamyces sp. JEL0680]
MRLFALAAFVAASPIGDWAGKLIPDQYIIVFKNDIHHSAIEQHWEWLHQVLAPVLPSTSLFSVQEDARVEQFIDQVSATTKYWDVFGVMHKYHFDDFKGYSARLPSFIVQLLQRHADIALIEQDQVVTIADGDSDPVPSVGSQKNTPAWGLVRISNREHPASTEKTYTYPSSAGSGVTAYIIDTGVHVAHPEFQGRARVGKSFTGDGTRDGNGHGTHVAGTIGSKTYGVAKNVSLVAVKVLDNQGSGTTANVIAGIDWAAKDAAKNKSTKRKSVANMSLGGGASAALDRAVKSATQSGLVFAVAAGNSAGDACKLSPARVPEAITVAASDKNDRLASFSEKGKCVDIIAPGVDIISTWNNGKTNIISGTSMATPHVCGVVALALAEGEFETVKQVHDYLKELASKDKVNGKLNGAPNSLLYNKVFGGGFPDDEPKEPEPQPDEPDEPPSDGECPIPQCLFDENCTSCCVDCLPGWKRA